MEKKRDAVPKREAQAVLSVRPVDLRFAVPTFTKGVKVSQPPA